MTKRSISKSIIKDIIIVVIAVLIIWIGLQITFGTQNPFYVVASGSMIPVLQVYDVLVVQGHEPFDNIDVEDIIVFNRPSDHNRVIVHRVVSVISEDPKTLMTMGDANSASIQGTDFPITEEEYIGKVQYILPQVGYITQLLKPPVNFIIIGIVFAIMIAKQLIGRRKGKNDTPADSPDLESTDSFDELSDIYKLTSGSEYTRSKETDELDDDAGEPKDIAKSDEIEETLEGIEDSIENDSPEKRD